MGKEILDLCMGLDIGTSTTKVIIHPIYASDGFFVVDFGKDKTREATYLLPTKLAFNEETGVFELPVYNTEQSISSTGIFGKIQLRLSKNKAPKQKIFENLKVNFMNQEVNSTEYLRVFIALVIQYSKNWFIKTYGDTDFVKNKEIMWAINMGIPSAKFSAEGENEKYIKLLKTAYNLSKQPQINGINFRKVYDEDFDIEQRIIPEIVAAISSFVKSEGAAAQDLYCAIDIGAGTTDVCTFRINNMNVDDENEIDIYSFFRSSVLELGVDRYNEAHDKDSVLESFFRQLGAVIWLTRTGRDPNASAWRNRLPLIICGGGSYMGEYRDVMHQYERNILIKQLGYNGFKGYKEVSLPNAQYIHVSGNIDPKRLLVAHGLCLFTDFFDDLQDRYVSEIDIPDIPKPEKKEYEEQSKDLC